MNDRDLLNALLRSDFKSFLYRCMLTPNPGTTFIPNWHIEAIAYQLQRVRAGEITRLIINLPPRYLKSLTVSVIFPAFLLGHNPRLKIFGISYGTELSGKHAADFRAIVQVTLVPACIFEYASFARRGIRRLYNQKRLSKIDIRQRSIDRAGRRHLYHRRSTETGGCTIRDATKRSNSMVLKYAAFPPR